MWTKVAKLSELEEGKGKWVQSGRFEIALFKSQGQVYAIDSVCPHRGGPLAEGHLEGGELTCPWHAWSFDVKTGKCLSIPEAEVKSFPTRVEKDDILLDL